MPQNALRKSEWQRRSRVGREMFEKRMRLGLTRAECAEKCGLTVGTYDQAENTRHSIAAGRSIGRLGRSTFLKVSKWLEDK